MTQTMKPDRFDIYMIGVGGQGIGLLSEVLLRAVDHAGLPVRSVDTHGLAQRGGTVESQVRIGAGAHSPLIQAGAADMVVALERHEALRGAGSRLAAGGTLVYYDAEWQPLRVRTREEARVLPETVEEACRRRDARLVRVFREDMPDPRMQNVAVLAEICRRGLVPGVRQEHYEAALDDLLAGPLLENNLKLFRAVVGEMPAGGDILST